MRTNYIYIFLIVLFGIFSFVSLAFAQEEAGEAGAVTVQRYEAKSYSIEPPASWTLVSGSLSEKEMAKLPDSIKQRYAVYTQRNSSDVIFMDLSYDNRTASGFQNSLNIVTINEPLEFNDDVIKELTSVLNQQFSSMFQSFKIQNIGIVKLMERDVLKVKGSYVLNDYKVVVDQVLVPLKTETVVMTCTYDEEAAETADGICTKVFESLQMK